jgi:hypothetical protein
MGRRRGWGSEQTGRPVLRSRARPPTRVPGLAATGPPGGSGSPGGRQLEGSGLRKPWLMNEDTARVVIGSRGWSGFQELSQRDLSDRLVRQQSRRSLPIVPSADGERRSTR